MAIVYKYYPPNQYTIDALLNGYFFFNKAKNQNDPYEVTFELINNTELREFLVNNCGIALNPDATMQEYGICCFSRDKINKHMWAFYAHNYTGLVVGFEDTEFSNLNDMYQVRIPYVSTKYVNECPSFQDEMENVAPLYLNSPEDQSPIYLSDVRTNERAREDFFVTLCSIKEQKTWSEEQECRLIACKDISHNKSRLEHRGIEYLQSGYKIPFHPSCVREIIIGHNFNMGETFLNGVLRKYDQISFVGRTLCRHPFDVGITATSVHGYNI